MKSLLFLVLALASIMGQTSLLPTFEDAVKLHSASSGPADAAKVEEAYAAFLATLPDSSQVAGGDGASERAFTLHNLALLARSQGDTGIPAALDYAITAAALLPEDALLRHAEASLLRTAGRSLEAVTAWRAALSLEPNMPHVLANLASTLHHNLADREDLAAPGGFERRFIALTEANTHYAAALTATKSAASTTNNGHAAGSPKSPLGPTWEVELRNDYALSLQAVNQPSEAIQVLREACNIDPGRLQSWGNLAVALKSAGDLEGALEAGRTATKLAPTHAFVRHNLALTLHALQRSNEAVEEWQAAVEADPTLVPALASLGHAAGHRGHLEDARMWYSRALDAAAAPGSSFQAEVGALRLQLATAVVPTIYASRGQAVDVRRNYTKNLRSLLQKERYSSRTLSAMSAAIETDASSNEYLSQEDSATLSIRIDEPLTSTGCGALGYYLIYTGHNDVHIRRLLATVYWRASPVLHYTAPFLLLQQAPEPSPPMHREQQQQQEPSHYQQQRQRRDRRLRIGFFSNFFYHHSVGLLTQGVITGLASPPYNDSFHITLIYPSPEEHDADAVSTRLKEAAHALCPVPSDNLPAAQRTIAALELDVLVFTEVGMDRLAYFLAFGRLARRTALFWGHATTSGITRFDAVAPTSGDRSEDSWDSGRGNSSSSSGDTSMDNAMLESSTNEGGIDYFVSSELFEAPFGGQRRYGERLYLMRGLTTCFHAPTPPDAAALAVVAAATKELGLPHLAPLDPAEIDDGTGARLYLVPQTLYKLHPDFDRLLREILLADPRGIVAMPAAAEDGWTQAAKQRLASALGPMLVQRLVLFRRLRFAEFSALAARAHVVLDPFPVGGGRSALEVFAVATPVVVLYPRTSILQLAAGFYVAMGMEEGPVPAGGEHSARTRSETGAKVGNLDGYEVEDDIADVHGGYDRVDGASSIYGGNNSSDEPRVLRLSSTTGLPSLIAHTSKEFVRIAVAVASNTTLRSELSATIAAAAPRSLYHQQGVVDEWAEFLTFADAAPRPPPFPWWQHPTVPRASPPAVHSTESPLSGSSGNRSNNAGGPEDALSARGLFGDVAVPSPTQRQLERAVALAVAADTRWKPSAAHAHSAKKFAAPIMESSSTSVSSTSSSDKFKTDSDVNHQPSEVEDRQEETSPISSEFDSLAELASSVPADVLAERQQPLALQVARSPTEWGYMPSPVSTEANKNENEYSSKPAPIWVNSGRTKRKPIRRFGEGSSRGWHWVPRPFGWEAMAGDPSEEDDGYRGQPNERASGLLYALKLSAEDNSNDGSSGSSAGGPSVSFLVEVWANGPSPAAVAAQLGRRIGAEPVKEAWLACVLARGATLSDGLVKSTYSDEITSKGGHENLVYGSNSSEEGPECGPSMGRAPLVWAMPLQLVDAADSETTLLAVASAADDDAGIDSSASSKGSNDGASRVSEELSRPSAGLWGSRTQPQIEVRLGDDVTQLAAWAAYRLDLGVNATAWLQARLERLTPERTSPAWVHARAQRHCLHLPWPPQHKTTVSQIHAPAHDPTLVPVKPTPILNAAFGSPPTSTAASFGGGHRSGCCRITVGITTCRRLPLFVATAKSLLAELGDMFQPGGSDNANVCPLVCRVVVVDDGSSPEDVAIMRKEFPFFEYVLKPPHRKGHANSLNLLFDLVANDVTQSDVPLQNLQYDAFGDKLAANTTNLNSPSYFLYLEDDWLWREGSLNALREAVALLDASRVLRAAQETQPLGKNHDQNKEKFTEESSSNKFVGIAEPLEQVLLNDQASRACAYAEPLDGCASTPLGAAGWPRTALLPVTSSDAGADVVRPVDYRLHEFGALGDDHAFGYWPGFTLNPALWDVTAIQAKLCAHQEYCQDCQGKRPDIYHSNGCLRYPDANLQFNASDLRFEQSMSLKLATVGVRVAYLQRLSVQHLGTEASAYELNGLKRPWDRNASSDKKHH